MRQLDKFPAIFTVMNVSALERERERIAWSAVNHLSSFCHFVRSRVRQCDRRIIHSCRVSLNAERRAGCQSERPGFVPAYDADSFIWHPLVAFDLHCSASHMSCAVSRVTTAPQRNVAVQGASRPTHTHTQTFISRLMGKRSAARFHFGWRTQTFLHTQKKNINHLDWRNVPRLQARFAIMRILTFHSSTSFVSIFLAVAHAMRQK